MLADVSTLEDEEYRIFDKIRAWPWYIAIPRDIILFSVGLIYGSFEKPDAKKPPKCAQYKGIADNNCAFHEAITFNYALTYYWTT